MNVPNFYVFDNPIIKEKVSKLRDISRKPSEFRKLVSEIASLMCYEIFSMTSLKEYTVTTPLEDTTGFDYSNEFTIIAVLRAGLGMVPGFLNIIPDAKIGMVGLYRDHDTLKPVQYYCNLPKNIENDEIIVVDPMLATGGSAIDSINVIKNAGAQNIKFACLISAPEGVENLHNTHPDVLIYTASLDRELNNVGYILPGLGDAGDRIFGTL